MSGRRYRADLPGTPWWGCEPDDVPAVRRTVEPSGWGWRWTVAAYSRIAEYGTTGWALTKRAGMRRSLPHYAKAIIAQEEADELRKSGRPDNPAAWIQRG